MEGWIEDEIIMEVRFELLDRSSFLLFKQFLYNSRHSSISFLLDILSELTEDFSADLIGELISVGCEAEVGEGVHPVPKLVVMQVAIDVGLVSVVFGVFLRVADLGLVAQCGVYVILVKIFASPRQRTFNTDFRQNAAFGFDSHGTVFLLV